MMPAAFDRLSPSERVEPLYYFFGWQGGTVHQLAAATGCTVETILSAPHGGGALSGGFSAVRTCDRDWRADRLAPQHQGDWPFWRDVISGYWATGALGKANA